MRIGLCGGTFDPLHIGHQKLIQAAMQSGQIDRIIVMPAGRPPHKQNEVVSMAGYRFEMACQAFAGQPAITVSDLEILRPGRSYTLDTIHQLKSQLPDNSELILIYGSDILFDLEKWHKPAEILAACPLLLASRGGIENKESLAKAAELQARFKAKISFFEAPNLDLSSTKIRQAVSDNLPYQQWLPERVAKFIAKNGLYRYQDELADITPELWQRFYDLERQIWPFLNRKRLLHSLNVMIYALHLAKVHGVSREQAGIAGLLHDCAKCLPSPEVLKYASQAKDPSLLGDELAHGPAGAWLCQERYGIVDPAILRAVHFHTTGCGGMTTLDKIIFIADKVEPARTYENLAEIRRLAEFDLDQSLAICLQEIDSFLIREKLTPHPYTKDARDDLSKGNACIKSGQKEPEKPGK